MFADQIYKKCTLGSSGTSVLYIGCMVLGSSDTSVLYIGCIVPKGYGVLFNPLALELDIYSSAHHLCKMLIFYEPRRVTSGNTRHFVEE